MIIFYSFIPCLYDEIGHHYSYHLALSEVFKINDWKDIKYIPKACKIDNLSKKWKKKLILYQAAKKRLLWKNVVKPLLNFFPFLQILANIKKNTNDIKIFFFEYFCFFHLMAFYLALIFIRPSNYSLWILYRTDLRLFIFKGRLHKILHKFLIKIIGKQNIKFFTDSEILAKQFEKFYQNKFNVLPIPHTNFFQKIKYKMKKNTNIYWWPGGSIREEKGFKVIKKLIKTLKGSNIKIAIANSAKSLISDNKIMFVKTNLSREEYETLMINSDLILLPYISDLYRFRTSGIFVEAIIAGSIPVVSKNTWMAYELLKFNIKDLILDWDSPKIINKLKNICDDVSIREKLKIMKQNYEKKHSVKNYAIIMKALLDKEIKKVNFMEN